MHAVKIHAPVFAVKVSGGYLKAAEEMGEVTTWPSSAACWQSEQNAREALVVSGLSGHVFKTTIARLNSNLKHKLKIS